MAGGPDLPGPEPETDGEKDHVLKHTAFLLPEAELALRCTGASGTGSAPKSQGWEHR